MDADQERRMGATMSEGGNGASENTTLGLQTIVYILLGIVLTVSAILWVFLGRVSTGVVYDTVEGIGVFAALYLIAQAAERAAEWTINLLALLPNSPESRKKNALRQVRAANSTLNGNPTLAAFGVLSSSADASPPAGELLASARTAARAATEGKKNAEKKVEKARRDIMFLAGGVSIAVSAWAVNALNYGLLKHIGAEGVGADLDRFFTVLAAAGGSTALHELIGRLQKTKESSESSAGATP